MAEASQDVVPRGVPNEISNSDQVDVRGFSNKPKSVTAQIKTVDSPDTLPVVDIHSKFYDMNHRRRGRAIIFNHYTFDNPNMGRREGTELDCTNLTNVLQFYGFDVTLCRDFKYGKIYDALNKVAEEDHSDHDCLLVAVLSHGDDGRLHAKDVKYKPETLWIPFRGDNCRTLRGKPKIFIVQACRGNSVDSGASIRTDSSSVHTIPALADILVMYSTFDGHYSFRSGATGSWFIQSLCQELMDPENHGRDLLQTLTFVNKRVAFDFKSNVPGDRDLDKKKQVGSIVSSFTKLLFLAPKI